MKITGTNNQLLQIRREIQEYSANSITYALFNQEKIKRFYQLNNIRLGLVDEKLNALVKKFVKHDDEQKPIKLKEAEGLAEWDYNNEDDRKAFFIEYADLMNKNLTIEL